MLVTGGGSTLNQAIFGRPAEQY